MSVIPVLSMITIIFISGLAFKITKDLIKFRQMTKIKEAVWKEKLNENKKGYFSYLRIEKYLISNGSPLKLTPYSFIQWKVILGIFMAIVLTKQVNIVMGILGLVIGFFILDLLIKLSNDGDNEKLVVDLSSIYDSLKIQTKAGVFITTALGECYLISQNRRLKKGLLELNADLILKKDLGKAIDKFNSKFNCHHIDSFCMTIKQSAESGMSSQALDDLSSQIKEINLVLSQQKANKIGRKLTLLQMGIFIGIIAMLIYSIFTELTRGLMNF